jgi:hypothetical protein
MSIEVQPGELSEMLARFPFAYLLTVGEQPRPHIVASSAHVVDGVVVVTDAGRGTRDRIELNELVTLLAPPYEPGGYSLIVDGTAVLTPDNVVVTPSRAVLHRPAPLGPPPSQSSAGACEQDCVELPVTPRP